MQDIIRVILAICAILIFNGIYQLLKVAAKAAEKDARKSIKSTKPARDTAPAAAIVIQEAPPPAPKKRGRPCKLPQTLKKHSAR